MHHPLTDIQADFEMNQPTRYQITAKNMEYWSKIVDTDGQTDRRTDGQTSRTTTIGIFFEKEEDNNTKIEKKILKINYFSHASS